MILLLIFMFIHNHSNCHFWQFLQFCGLQKIALPIQNLCFFNPLLLHHNALESQKLNVDLLSTCSSLTLRLLNKFFFDLIFVEEKRSALGGCVEASPPCRATLTRCTLQGCGVVTTATAGVKRGLPQHNFLARFVMQQANSPMQQTTHSGNCTRVLPNSQ
ncbi:hypothetical protein FN846DRAFT_189091 [Sphaerosporella brunnea]|uniref:Secreted protein n=1 Tax=Sphaerosporella brunnea TaxID=1250544 RepID=A0A5J5EQB5_9PEZI|nr:hypothetical protein FN846DRAFT_189091 [Sphaerosporella brunnea]